MLKNKIANLISLIEGTEINEIEVSSFWGAQKIKLSKTKAPSRDNNQIVNKEIKSESIDIEETIVEDSPDINNKEEPQVDISKSVNTNNENVDPNKLHHIKAPLVGTYYSSNNPDSDSFVKIGDKVSSGQVLCIIEAMKIFNEIESDQDGVIKDILVENGSPVEFDQLLFAIDPE